MMEQKTFVKTTDITVKKRTSNILNGDKASEVNGIDSCTKGNF